MISGSGSSASTSSSASPFLASSPSSSTGTATTSTAHSTPSWQSPTFSLSRSKSSSSNRWSGDSRSAARRIRHDSDISSKKSSDGNTTSSCSNNNKHISGYSIASTTNDSYASSTVSPRDDWWEHVLPPGQLAERLRKAQSSSSSLNVEEAKPSRRSILRNATPSERKIWTSLADFGQEKAQLRSGGNSTRSSVGSLPSFKSDVSSISGTSSSAEDSMFEGLGPAAKEETSYQWDRSVTSPPTSSLSIHRSTSLRRSRVVGDNNDSSIGLGLGGTNISEVDERLRQWNFSTTSVPSLSNSNHLRPFPSTTGGRHSPLHVLGDTPEVSSEEEQRLKRESVLSSATTTRTTRRISRTTNSIRSLDLLNDEPSVLDTKSDMPGYSARRQSWNSSVQNPTDRHVSFLGDDKGQWHNQTLGRAAGRYQSMLNDSSHNRRTWQPEQSRRSTKVLPTYSSDATFDATKMHFAPHQTQSRIRRRTTCYSAPTSPRADLHALPSDKPVTTPVATPLRKQVKVVRASSDNLEPHLALYSSSMSLAQNRMASAGNLALTLTRQLSVPLRPMLHLTMLLSISSFTFMALAGFLIAGYLITAWDDVNNRGKRIQNNVSGVTRKVEAGLHWCERLITGEESPSPSFHHLHRSSSSIVTAPIRLAFAVPTTIAYKLTPTSISESLGFSDGAAAPMPSSQQRPSKSPHHESLPPRPPLSSLLPSIFLTIMLALGAGLASFFANRAASPTSSPFATTSSTIPRPQASSSIPMRKRSSVPSHTRRHSYDVMSM